MYPVMSVLQASSDINGSFDILVAAIGLAGLAILVLFFKKKI
ncbi:MAG: hypothetical protein OK438_06935 [Thaumarchaeota archaeon]|nr:hypothetical protein [Nitrososphaerota archaeon]